MGFPMLMRVIDREVAGSNTLSPTVSQALSDLHVLAVCPGETGNHFRWVSNLKEQDGQVELHRLHLIGPPTIKRFWATCES